MEDTGEKRKWNKKVIILSVIALLCMVGIYVLGNYIGDRNATVELEGEKKSREEMLSEVAKMEGQLMVIEDELTEIKKEQETKTTELEALQEEYDETQSIIDQKSDLENELTTLNSNKEEIEDNISQLTTELSDTQTDLESKIADAEAQLQKLENGIVAKKAEPKNLPAGFFEVGNDIPEGRYKVQTNGGFGNFFVNEGSKANILLDTVDDLGVSEYIIKLVEGDDIETTIPTKYTLVEE
ncbi:hypothetical protein [Gracilibacillus timonensis]|uniref:hypothetical protein n=1 Tax=Gracilibacillus timonensis TaxID=1816696 RepID=UPI0008246B2B|nr:hypothetical protein [Gracilibacillus timonensis]